MLIAPVKAVLDAGMGMRSMVARVVIARSEAGADQNAEAELEEGFAADVEARFAAEHEVSQQQDLSAGRDEARRNTPSSPVNIPRLRKCQLRFAPAAHVGNVASAAIPKPPRPGEACT